MRKSYWFPLITLWISTVAVATSFTFKKSGQDIKTLDLPAIQGLELATDVTVYLSNLNKNVTYTAVPTIKLLDNVYGDEWKKFEEVLFTCADGYQPSVPVSYLLKFPSFLAYGQKTGPFELPAKDKDSAPTPLGPYFLVWDNLKHLAIKADGTGYWPFQVTTVDLVNFRDRFGKMAPPKNSSKQVLDGFVLFRSRCLTCHTINGEGWKKGVELNYPVSITEYLPEKWLRKWITDPNSMRYNATMPPFSTETPTWRTDLDAILAYLKTMAKNKQKP